MSGVKGAGGPVPKRSDQRRHRGETAAGEPTKVPAGAPVKKPTTRRKAGEITFDSDGRPVADPKWDAVAVLWFNSLGSSGQSVFYEPSDWATAYLTAESISRELAPQPLLVTDAEGVVKAEMHRLPPKAASVAAWLKAMTALLTTEGDRRRAAVELVRPQADPVEGDGDVSRIDDARLRLRGAG